VGKRSRKRGGLEVADRPQPPRAGEVQRQSAATRPPRPQYREPVPQSLFERMAESWRVAGQRPSKQMPKSERVAARPERPPGMFGGLPVSEIVMLAGLVGLVIGFTRGPDAGSTLIGVSLAVVALGTFELSAREHFSGYRSHTLLLSLILTVAVHAAVSLILGGDTRKSPLLIGLDIALFTALAATLGARYKTARRALREGTTR
jgi:hypothetical protein